MNDTSKNHDDDGVPSLWHDDGTLNDTAANAVDEWALCGPMETMMSNRDFVGTPTKVMVLSDGGTFPVKWSNRHPAEGETILLAEGDRVFGGWGDGWTEDTYIAKGGERATLVARGSAGNACIWRVDHPPRPGGAPGIGGRPDGGSHEN